MWIGHKSVKIKTAGFPLNEITPRERKKNYCHDPGSWIFHYKKVFELELVGYATMVRPFKTDCLFCVRKSAFSPVSCKKIRSKWFQSEPALAGRFIFMGVITGQLVESSSFKWVLLCNSFCYFLCVVTDQLIMIRIWLMQAVHVMDQQVDGKNQGPPHPESCCSGVQTNLEHNLDQQLCPCNPEKANDKIPFEGC